VGFKVKRDNFKVENSINEAENEQRLDILNRLSTLDIKTLQIAYVYAKNYVEYGTDVTEKWATACENIAYLERAHHKGYCEGYEKAKQNYCDKWRMKNVFGDEDVILNHQNPIYKFEIGQIVGKCERYPNHSKFKILDRFVVNLTRPYYKIGLIDRFFNDDSQEIVPNWYQYVPESELYSK